MKRNEMKHWASRLQRLHESVYFTHSLTLAAPVLPGGAARATLARCKDGRVSELSDIGLNWPPVGHNRIKSGGFCTPHTVQSNLKMHRCRCCCCFCCCGGSGRNGAKMNRETWLTVVWPLLATMAVRHRQIDRQTCR